MTWPSPFAAGPSFSRPLSPRIRAQHDARHDGAERKHPVHSFHLVAPLSENPGCNPGLDADLLKALDAPNVFLHSELSEMTHKPSETTEKSSEYSRESDRVKVRDAVRYLANPVQPGENIGAQILKVYRHLVREGLKDLKFSRVRDFWHADKRMCVRGFERKAIEGIAARHKIKLDIGRLAAAAGEIADEANAHAAHAGTYRASWPANSDGREGPGRHG
jgi:hypothetical protein